MTYFLSILAGLIQGVTEFLPISSSGHLLVFHELFNFNLPDNLAFDAILHLGTFFALLVFFWRDVLKLIKGFFSSLTNWNLANDLNQRLAWLIVVGSIPGVIAGVLFNDLIDKYFHEGRAAVLIVAIMLAVVGGLFFLAEKFARQTQEIKDMNFWQSLICGVAQAVALIPGVSRSGITIITGMAQKMKREEAARYSFLLSMPIVFGAGAKSLLKVGVHSGSEFLVLACGFLAAVISGYFVIKFFLKYISGHSLAVFGWYRLVLAAIIVIWLIIK